MTKHSCFFSERLVLKTVKLTKYITTFLLTNTKDCDNIMSDKGCDEEGSVCHLSEKERLVKAPVMISVFVASEPGRRKLIFSD